jgi:hypothetical protein
VCVNEVTAVAVMPFKLALFATAMLNQRHRVDWCNQHIPTLRYKLSLVLEPRGQPLQATKKERRGSFSLRGAPKERRSVKSASSLEDSRRAAIAKSRARHDSANGNDASPSVPSASSGETKVGSRDGAKARSSSAASSNEWGSFPVAATDAHSLSSASASELRATSACVVLELKQASAPSAVVESLERLLAEMHNRLDAHERGTPVSLSLSERPTTPVGDAPPPDLSPRQRPALSSKSDDSVNSVTRDLDTAPTMGIHRPSSSTSADGDVDEPSSYDDSRTRPRAATSHVIMGRDGVARPRSPATPSDAETSQFSHGPPPSTGTSNRFNTGFLEVSLTIEEVDDESDGGGEGEVKRRAVESGEETQEDREKRASGVLHSLGAHAQHFWADGFDSDDSETYLDDLDWDGQDDDGGTEI